MCKVCDHFLLRSCSGTCAHSTVTWKRAVLRVLVGMILFDKRIHGQVFYRCHWRVGIM